MTYVFRIVFVVPNNIYANSESNDIYFTSDIKAGIKAETFGTLTKQQMGWVSVRVGSYCLCMLLQGAIRSHAFSVWESE